MNQTLELFQDLGGTLTPLTQNTVLGQMKLNENSTKFANTEPRPVSMSLAVAKRVEASEGPERTGHKPLMRNPSANRPSRQAVLPATPFDGDTFNESQDGTRLKAQLVRVRECQRDGKWRSLAEIAAITDDPESSVSARLRDLRKPRFGLWTVERRRLANGLHEYRLGGKGL